jgi:hypothetical protein
MRRRSSILVFMIALAALAVGLPSALAAPGDAGPGGSATRILVTVHPLDWKPLFGNPNVSPGLDVSLFSVDEPGVAAAGAAPDLPTSINSRRLRLVEVQFCYDATHASAQTDVTMTQFLTRVDNNTTDTGNSNPVAGALDTTHRSDETCRTYPVDWVLAPGDMVATGITVNFDTAGEYFEIGRLTFVLATTNQPT